MHRVQDDGSAPKDNPFANRSGALPSIWTYGHRNPQGLTFDAAGRMWETEHGPKGGDELNRLEPGRNYGWGVISHGIQDGITKTAQEGMEQPIVHWTPAIGPSSILFYSDGLVEAHDPEGQMFSFPRLRTLVAEHTEEGALGEYLLEELYSFVGEGWEQEDDITLLTLRRSASRS